MWCITEIEKGRTFEELSAAHSLCISETVRPADLGTAGIRGKDRV